MDDSFIYEYPEMLDSIIRETESLGFDMASEQKTGALLKVLAASKPNGSFLELGTGTGLSAAWILGGMDSHSSLISLDNDPSALGVAKRNLGNDELVEFLCQDGESWLENNQNKRFDFIFADAPPGKFIGLELALNILKKGGLYIIDDLLPQKNWPEGHAPKVPRLMQKIESKYYLKSLRISWASGLMVVTKCEYDSTNGCSE